MFDMYLFFFKQKTAYEMRISDWSSDVCSSDLVMRLGRGFVARAAVAEIVAVEDARFFEQPHGAVNGRDRDAAVDLRCAFIEGQIGRASCRERVCQYV